MNKKILIRLSIISAAILLFSLAAQANNLPYPYPNYDPNKPIVKHGNLNVNINAGMSNGTIKADSTNVLIGSFNVTTSPYENIKLVNIDLSKGCISGQIQNLKLKTDQMQIGPTLAVSDFSTNLFKNLNLTIPAASTKVINIYADIPNNMGSGSICMNVKKLGIKASGATSKVSFYAPSNIVKLQTMSITQQ